jgi:hypothetical protein
MTDEAMNPVVVLRTGQVWQIDMAINALKEAHIPHLAEEETASGLRLAMPVAPSPGPGVCWTLRVPASQVDRAQQVLSALPFEVKTNPGAWDFNPDPAVKRVWGTWIVVALVFLALIGVATVVGILWQ